MVTLSFVPNLSDMSPAFFCVSFRPSPEVGLIGLTLAGGFVDEVTVEDGREGGGRSEPFPEP